ncbi:MAG: phosphatase PAP2 family protein [Candidatus Bipolaricaulota bacterium]|nr:phosphatase PAP2 family protein [Candidatus Bipolaricaulota bacterium]MCS7275169.1 phosphatase PAP2 family protein [Candidatus Bipolaricaulota bacterium]MDW8110462.1 phosphatase PAP2 family protein [Candidatus Bipolaricaulota bacterium]MDW8329143.1 phosphatase PAP2 family protein [Candidatus Bipolaricaulota bacterium]
MIARAQALLQRRFLALYHYLADILPYLVIRWDERYLHFVSAHRTMRKISPVMIVATYFGDGYLWGVIGLLILILGSSLDRKYVMVGFAITMINIALFRLLKAIFKRERPLYVAPLYDLRYRFLDSYSFPSGHATTSFGIAYVLGHFYPEWWVYLGAYGAASLIAVSRIHVAEHYPSDVIAGALLGTLSASFLIPIFERIFRL